MTSEAQAQALTEALRGIKAGDQIVIDLGPEVTPPYLCVLCSGVTSTTIKAAKSSFSLKTGIERQGRYGGGARRIATITGSDGKARPLNWGDADRIRREAADKLARERLIAECRYLLSYFSGTITIEDLQAIEAILDAHRDKRRAAEDAAHARRAAHRAQAPAE